MPTWNEINEELDKDSSIDALDRTRHHHLQLLSKHVDRPVIAYYSGYLQKGDDQGRIHVNCTVTDLDMNGFMAVCHQLERNKGLDLILHTPGGGIEASRSIIEYLYKMFGRDIRVIVPQIAMSAGTMMACAAREILLAKHSCLGPTDPQMRGTPAMGVLYEIDKAIKEIQEDQARLLFWQHVFSKYPPAFVSDCERAVDAARRMIVGWLANNMFKDEVNPNDMAEKVAAELMNYSETSEHGHHFLFDYCQQIGLNVKAIEENQDLQELVLSVHHSYMATFARSDCLKQIDNSDGKSWSIQLRGYGP